MEVLSLLFFTIICMKVQPINLLASDSYDRYMSIEDVQNRKSIKKRYLFVNIEERFDLVKI